ncbi:MAG: hypothetical protein AB4352_24445 [Hormoscilla sp.]
MFNSHQWKSGTAALLALSMTAVAATPLMASAEEQQNSPDVIETQRYPENRNDRVIPAGILIPVKHEDEDVEKILLAPDETMELTLIVSEDVVTRNGKRLIPGGSQISGELVPALDGVQFISEEIVTPRGRRVNIDASSGIVTETETVSRGVNAGSVIEGALIGGAAAAIIAEITGKIDLEEPIIGAVLGGIAGALLGKNKVDLISINPETDLPLRLNSDIVIDRGRRRPPNARL